MKYLVEHILSELWNPGFLSSVMLILITALATWFFTRRKTRSEIDSNNLKSALDALTIWETTVAKLQKDVEDLMLQNEMAQLERTKCKEAADQLKAQVEDLTKEIKQLKNENGRLRKALEKRAL